MDQNPKSILIERHRPHFQNNDHSFRVTFEKGIAAAQSTMSSSNANSTVSIGSLGISGALATKIPEQKNINNAKILPGGNNTKNKVVTAPIRNLTNTKPKTVGQPNRAPILKPGSNNQPSVPVPTPNSHDTPSKPGAAEASNNKSRLKGRVR